MTALLLAPKDRSAGRGLCPARIGHSRRWRHEILPPAFGARPPVSERETSGSNPNTFQTAGTYGKLLNREHTVLKRRSFSYGDTAASPPAITRTLSQSRKNLSQVRLFTVDCEAGRSLRYRVAAFSATGGRIMVIAVPLREVDQTLQRLVVVEGLVGAAVIVSLLILGWVVIRLGLHPFERIGRVANQIAHGDLSRRVTPANPRTEIGRLGLALNQMLAQIEQAFQDRSDSEDRLRRFLADASHELRTPLALIRGYAELFRLGVASSPTATPRSMTRIEAEATRMGALVADLLLLAQLDELPEIRRGPVELAELANTRPTIRGRSPPPARWCSAAMILSISPLIRTSCARCWQT